jgi:hypothetical protein
VYASNIYRQKTIPACPALSLSFLAGAGRVLPVFDDTYRRVGFFKVTHSTMNETVSEAGNATGLTFTLLTLFLGF